MTDSEQLVAVLAEMLREAAETVDRLCLRLAEVEAENRLLRDLTPYPPR